MPDFTKKSPQNWQPPFPQVASDLTNPAFRADGMTFEVKTSGSGAMKFWLLALSFQRLVGVFFLKANCQWLNVQVY